MLYARDSGQNGARRTRLRSGKRRWAQLSASDTSIRQAARHGTNMLYPWQIPFHGWLSIARHIARRMLRDHVLIASSGVAFLAPVAITVFGRATQCGHRAAQCLAEHRQWFRAATWIRHGHQYPRGRVCRRARWLVIAAAGLISMTVLYRFGPSHEGPRWEWLSAGSVVGTGLWLAGSAGMSFYVAHMNEFGNAYGPLGMVMVVMTWFFLTAFVFLFGAEFNVAMEREIERTSAATQ